ncbi:MAG: transcription initiation factor IIB family protein [Halobacteriales archaeon]|nr:transcription initiation factor IIB family protein [Halobacteriales archaeon]
MSTTATTCPECTGTVTAHGTEQICSECGLVVSEDTLDRGPEWRSFSDDEHNPKRTGAPLTRSRHDKGLSTEIGHSTRLKGRKRRRVARMRRQHKRAQIATKRERNQVYGFTEIRQLVSGLSLGEAMREQACALFESAQSADLFQGRSLEGFAAAAVYAICRVNGLSRTLEEVAETAKATPDELRVAYDALNRDLGLPVGPVHPREYLARFASELGVEPRVEQRARELAERTQDEQLFVGRNPAGVAAGCLYAATQEQDLSMTQAEIAEVAGVTPVTLRRTYTDLCNGE